MTSFDKGDFSSGPYKKIVFILHGANTTTLTTVYIGGLIGRQSGRSNSRDNARLSLNNLIDDGGRALGKQTQSIEFSDHLLEFVAFIEFVLITC